MSLSPDGLRFDEQVSYTLRGLFELCGYKRYKIGKFEEYGLYLENKNFISSERVVTFTAPDGRLLALRPDVTLSIAKSTGASRSKNEKLYYVENVCRLDPRTREFREINQMGLEFFGDIDDYATMEVIRLALRSLAEIDSEFVLDISHMGFVGGLVDSLGVNEETRGKLLECIRSKNLHDLEKTARTAGVSQLSTDRMCRLAGLSGELEECLSAAEEIADGDEMMKCAAGELRRLSELISDHQLANRIMLDFSIVNDIGYYNGVIFQGYVRRVPRAVLSGGRYDNLLMRFGRDAGAIGFALYLDEIGAKYTEPDDYDVDVFILYDSGSDLKALSKEVGRFIYEGKRVRAEKTLPKELRCAFVYRFQNGDLKEVDAGV